MTPAAVDDLLRSRPRWQVVALALALLCLISMADYVTGFEISFAVFYLLPIVLAAWYLGLAPGVAMCALSATIWLAIDLISGNRYSESWIALWNATTRLMFFVAIAYLLARLKRGLTDKESLIRRDVLTGVSSLRGFREEAARVFAFAGRHGHPVALGYIDLDGFKALNDSRGHTEGDKALQRVGVELNLHIRASDIAARVGGDEFVVLMAAVDHDDARVSFTRLHSRLQAAMRDAGWAVGFSIGVAVFANAEIGIKAALERADALMYIAKKAGGNRIVCRSCAITEDGIGSGAEKAR